ncbi:MAG: hypothetical protein NTY67_06585 [Cyanobacteria bacterium]|nr:hypothetical protein [Cyanobacteriota bacterium]
MIRPDFPNAFGPRAAQRLHGRVLGLGLGLLALAVPFGTTAARAQAQPAAAAPPAAAAAAFDVAAVRQLLARGDAAAAAGNLSEARRFYDDARDASRRLAGFYRTIAGAFRGLDARIPREMDDKGRQSIELLAEANMRLAALFRRQGQPEVAVPLLVEVLTATTPTSEQGRKAYQQLVEIGFVATPYAAGAAAGN